MRTVVDAWSRCLLAAVRGECLGEDTIILLFAVAAEKESVMIKSHTSKAPRSFDQPVSLDDDVMQQCARERGCTVERETEKTRTAKFGGEKGRRTKS